MRRTEVRPIFNWRAISALLTPVRNSFRTSVFFRAAVLGRPSRFPFSRASASPARTRSQRIECSNSAKTESRPAIARPVDVVRSRASVSDTKVTPSSASSFNVTTRSAQFVAWEALRQQMGTDYRDPKDFKKSAQAALRKVLTLYPGLTLGKANGGFTLHAGRLAVPARDRGKLPE